jgi:hypothetical protein
MKLLCLVSLLWLCIVREISAAPLRLSYSVIGPTVAGIWMAHDYGTFKKYGLDVQLVYVPCSGTNIQALLGGSLDISAPGISGVVLAAARGAPVLAIGAMTNRPPMTLYVHPHITRTVTTVILRKLGLEQTATMRPLGGQREIQAAFEQRQIAGMVTAVRRQERRRALC